MRIDLCEFLGGIRKPSFETDRQYAIIKKMGIYYIQGYFFDKPMCIESFEEKYI